MWAASKLQGVISSPVVWPAQGESWGKDLFVLPQERQKGILRKNINGHVPE